LRPRSDELLTFEPSIYYLSLVIGYWSFDDLKLAGFKTNDKSPMTNSIAPSILSSGSIHAGTAEPFRVSPPWAAAYPVELISPTVGSGEKSGIIRAPKARHNIDNNIIWDLELRAKIRKKP
jgi:hypothetical protein